MDCGAFSTTLSRGETDTGRIQVKGHGSRLIASGIAEAGKTRIVLNAAKKRPGRWTGKLKTKVEGSNATINYVFDLVTEERIKGTMRARVKAAGQTCTLKRGFKLTYLGE